MFTKLLKHDFRFSWKLFFSMFAGLVLLAIIARIIEIIPDEPLMVEIFRVIIITAGGIGVLVTSYVQILLFFYRNFFSQEGYLMLTLPVSRGKQLASKIIVSLAWFNFMMLTIPIMLFILAPPTGNTWEAVWGVLTNSSFHVFILEVNFIALVLISFLFLTVTLANSVVFGAKIHSAIAGVISGILHIGFFWVQNLLSNRFRENYVFHHPDGWTQMRSNVPQIGWEYGRLATDNMWETYRTYVDIWSLGMMTAVAAGAIALTLYLLKKRIALR